MACPGVTGTPEGEEGVGDEGHGSRLALDGMRKIGPVIVLRDIRQAHPAECVHQQIQGSRYQQERHEVAIVALHYAHKGELTGS